jgi:hypothetical protein
MRLKRVTDFINENIEGPNKPDIRTVRKWDGVKKYGGEYYIDLDHPAYRNKSDEYLDKIHAA